MDGDARFALTIRAGCPRTLDYRDRGAQFWAVKEFLVKYLVLEERGAAFAQLSALQRIGFQGFPGLGVNMEVAETLRQDASMAVRAYGRRLLPWVKWPTEEDEKKVAAAEMAAESQELIDAWIQRFEPENAVAKPAEP